MGTHTDVRGRGDGVALERHFAHRRSIDKERTNANFSRASVLAALALLTGLFGAGSPTSASAEDLGNAVTTPSGLQIIDSKVGIGATPHTGQICVMHYTGWLYQMGAKGKKFDSSVDRSQPFEFPIGGRR